MKFNNNQAQFGSNTLDTTKNIVIANDQTTGDLVFSKGTVDGTQTEIGRLPNTGLVDYADDTAAAAGGVAIGSFYRTASAVKVRVA